MNMMIAVKRFLPFQQLVLCGGIFRGIVAEQTYSMQSIIEKIAAIRRDRTKNPRNHVPDTMSERFCGQTDSNDRNNRHRAIFLSKKVDRRRYASEKITTIRPMHVCFNTVSFF